MPEIQPFAGLVYRGGDGVLQRVLAPPYDVITPEQQEDLYARDPHNIVRVVLNRLAGDAGYQEAGDTFARWRSEGVLAADATPALYVLEQDFELDGHTLRRRGLLARFRAEDPGGSILPHEHTRSGPKEDRWRVLSATRANFSPIFLMVGDPEHSIASALRMHASGPPELTYTDDAGVVHRVWRVTHADEIAGLQGALARTRAYIADGHHRYATALRYRDAHGPQGAWTLGYFTSMDDPGLLVQPYHRVLSPAPTLAKARAALSAQFLINDAGSAAAAAAAAAQSTMPYAFALASREGAFVAEALPEVEDLLPGDAPLPLRVLDTFFAHEALLPRILHLGADSVRYVHSLGEAEEAIAADGGALALLLRPTPVRQIVDVAEGALSMPAKSTFFYPKLPSGLVIHTLPD